MGLFDKVTMFNEMIKKEMTIQIVTTLRQDALKLRTMAQEDKDTKATQEEMLSEVYRVLAVCFGEPVQKFDFTYNDA